MCFTTKNRFCQQIGKSGVVVMDDMANMLAKESDILETGK